MNTTVKRWIPLIAAVVIVAVIAVILIVNMNRDSDLPSAPAFSLQNTLGETISLENTSGKARLVYFYFAHCPDVCLPTNHMLATVQEGLKEAGVFGDKAQIMSITFDPERDTTEYLQQYMAGMEADSAGWHFLRDDDVEASRALAEEYQVTVIPDGDDNFIHANIYTLVDGKGKIVKQYYPNEVIVVNPEKTQEFLDGIIEDMVKLAK